MEHRDEIILQKILSEIDIELSKEIKSILG